MKKLNLTGYFLTILFPIMLFLSYKGEQTLSYLIMLFFLLSMLFKKNRERFKSLIDGGMASGLLFFIISPFIISFFSGGIVSRVDSIHYLYWLIFFPLVFYINTEKKLWTFIKSFLIGGTISLIITLVIFIKNYDEWAHPQGLVFPRIYFELQTQDFANIMSILLLFLLCFILFYRNENRKKNIWIKLLLSGIFLLDLFIIIVNRSKMVYISLFLPVIYILYKKNKVYILGFFAACLGGFFLLPKSITERLQYIIKYKQDPSSYLRILFWDAAISSFKKSPIFGMSTNERIAFNMSHFKKEGILNYIDTNYGLDPVGITNTHNMYLHHLANYGIAGVIPLIYFLFIVIPSRLVKLNFHKMKDTVHSGYIALETGMKASYIAYLIQGLTEFNLNKKPMIFTLAMMLAILNFMYKKLKK